MFFHSDYFDYRGTFRTVLRYEWVHQTITLVAKSSIQEFSATVGTIVDQQKYTETSWSSAQLYKPQYTKLKQLKLLYLPDLYCCI